MSRAASATFCCRAHRGLTAVRRELAPSVFTGTRSVATAKGVISAAFRLQMAAFGSKIFEDEVEKQRNWSEKTWKSDDFGDE